MHCCTSRKQTITTNIYDNMPAAGKFFPFTIYERFGTSTYACVIIPVLKDGKLKDGVCTLCRSPISTIQVALKPLWLCPLGKIDSLSEEKKSFLKQLVSKNADPNLISTLNLTLEFFIFIYTCCFCAGT